MRVSAKSPRSQLVFLVDTRRASEWLLTPWEANGQRQLASGLGIYASYIPLLPTSCRSPELRNIPDAAAYLGTNHRRNKHARYHGRVGLGGRARIQYARTHMGSQKGAAAAYGGPDSDVWATKRGEVMPHPRSECKKKKFLGSWLRGHAYPGRRMTARLPEPDPNQQR